MPPKVTDSTSSRSQGPLKDRCRYTSAHGRRCLNPLRSGTAGFCIIHERLNEQHNDAQAQSISDQLFSGVPKLSTREELGRVMAQLFTLIAQRKIRQREGALLAYVASLLLQTMIPTAAPADPPVGVVWDIPMGEASEEELQRRQRSQNSNPQFPNRT
jgi:hypothetical protein